MSEETRKLLSAALYALNMIPNRRLDRTRYRDTYALAAAITEHLENTPDDDAEFGSRVMRLIEQNPR